MYTGDTYTIDCSRGGLTGDINLDSIPPEMMLNPTRNLNLHNGIRQPRGGTSIIDTIAGSDRYRGVTYFQLNNGNKFIVRALDTGSQVDIYKDDTTTIKTALTTGQNVTFEVLNNELYIANGSNTPEVWSGAGNTSTLAAPHADWAGANQPKQLIKHGRANAERMWALGALPNFVYFSTLNDGAAEADFTGGTSGNFYIETGATEGTGIIGGIEFGDRLVLFSKRKSYIIDDSDSTITNWGYKESIWDGGAANANLIIRIPNDIICMMDDGEIYRVSATETYGDYKQASITRPSKMHRWIKDYIDLSKIDSFHAIYDPVIRAVKFFVVRLGQTNIDTALIYYLDRPLPEAWMVHGNWNNASGYGASASCLYEVSKGNWQVYTGDYAGNLWSLETANFNDNNAAYYAGWKTTNISYLSGDVEKAFRDMIVVAQPEGVWDLQITVWIDGVAQATKTVSMAGTGGVLGSFVLGTSLLGGNEIIHDRADLLNRGKRVQFEFFNTTVNQDFKVSKILVHAKALGVDAE